MSTNAEVMTEKEIADFKMAYYIVNKLGHPKDEELCDWTLFKIILENSQNTLWNLSNKVMNGVDDNLKLMMVDWANDCDMHWDGTRFVDNDVYVNQE